MAGPWGYHAQFNCAGCDKKKITDPKNIKKFVSELIKAIKMKQYGETILEHFAEHDPTKAGYTMLALIETSNLCAHFVDDSGEAYIDVFSCLDFDEYVAKEVIEKYFAPSSMNFKKEPRQA